MFTVEGFEQDAVAFGVGIESPDQSETKNRVFLIRPGKGSSVGNAKRVGLDVTVGKFVTELLLEGVEVAAGNAIRGDRTKEEGRQAVDRVVVDVECFGHELI